MSSKMDASEANITAWLDAAIELARSAGEMAREAVECQKDIEVKTTYADLVTETDKKVEDFLFTNLEKQFPGHKFIGEESMSSGAQCNLTDAPTWIIDPIDGTMNFVHRFPYFAISIGLAVNKKCIIGVIYQPIFDRMYSAASGRGAFCNGKKIKVSEVTDISQALIISETGNQRTTEVMDQVFTNFRNLVAVAHGLRALGSACANMCAIACGEADAYFEYTIHCWDIAAGKVIVEEAGGVVLDPEGGPLDLMGRRVLCASSSSLAKAVSGKLKHIQMPKD